MKVPPHAYAYEMLLLQAADEGRKDILFGESFERARKAALPFMLGDVFPSVYLEHPLKGDPFLDATVLYNSIPHGTHIASGAAAGTDAMLEWFAGVCHENPGVTCGFELDTKEAVVPQAAVHFQPRGHTEFVEPFFAAAGERERARLYLNQSARMPAGWPLSFFGMFGGRCDSPLRVCGYLDGGEQHACANDQQRLADAFDSIGFTAYDSAMLSQVSTIMHMTPGQLDFQFDVFADGTLGDTFSLDVRLSLGQPQAVRAAFEDGPERVLMSALEAWGVADGRWKLDVDAALAHALNVELSDGMQGKYALALMPKWVKVRWSSGVLQPAKMYLNAHAGLVD